MQKVCKVRLMVESQTPRIFFIISAGLCAYTQLFFRHVGENFSQYPCIVFDSTTVSMIYICTWFLLYNLPFNLTLSYYAGGPTYMYMIRSNCFTYWNYFMYARENLPLLFVRSIVTL